MENFHSAFNQMSLLYDITMLPEEFEEIGLIAWNRIGNKQTRLYRYVAHTDEDLSIELPCNFQSLEAVTLPYEDWQYTTSTTHYGDYASQFTENYIEGLKRYKDPIYQSGKYVKYHQSGDKLYFNEPHHEVIILYRGVELDDDGLPYLNDREKDAIACFCAHIKKFREGLATHNQAVMKEAEMLELRWKTLCDHARTPENISQNDMNKILDAKTNWNRKIFNKSYKPVK